MQLKNENSEKLYKKNLKKAHFNFNFFLIQNGYGETQFLSYCRN